MFIIWIVITVVLYLIFRDKLDLGNTKDPALDILQKRYAKGEISKNEFDEMKQNLI